MRVVNSSIRESCDAAPAGAQLAQETPKVKLRCHAGARHIASVGTLQQTLLRNAVATLLIEPKLPKSLKHRTGDVWGAVRARLARNNPNGGEYE
jgi:hypothetical protein